MLRKLISFDAFSDIEGKSLSNAGYELAEASDYLSEILDKGELALHCYNANNVYYQTNEGSYVHAEYKLNNNEIELKNIEEVVIDEETQTQARRKLLHSMLESLMANDKPRATESFRSVLEMMVPKMKKTSLRRTRKLAMLRVILKKALTLGVLVLKTPPVPPLLRRAIATILTKLKKVGRNVVVTRAKLKPNIVSLVGKLLIVK